MSTIVFDRIRHTARKVLNWDLTDFTYSQWGRSWWEGKQRYAVYTLTTEQADYVESVAPQKALDLMEHLDKLEQALAACAASRNHFAALHNVAPMQPGDWIV
jgi:hypothetical protein